jgi:glycerol-3-phosphate O-acyltransferase
MELFKTVLRLARHRQLVDGQEPDLPERRQAFLAEIATATRRANRIAEIARQAT